MNKHLLCLIIGIFLSNSIWGQTSDPKNSLYQNQIGPSPIPASLGKHGMLPVNFYTGVPDISVPIHTIESQGISVPISLRYHAGGIKVDDESSQVGLGWSLDAGGIINRTVRDRDDFERLSGYLNNEVPEVFNDRLNVEFKLHNNVSVANSSCNYIIPYGELSSSLLPNSPNDHTSKYDTEPDSYSYKFLQYSGNFVIRKNKEVVKEKADGVLIKLTKDDGSEFLIITPDGNKHSFSVTERVSIKEGDNLPVHYITTWFLNKIETPTGASLTFNYHAEQAAFATNVSQLYQSVVLAYNTISSDPNAGGCPLLNGIQESYPPIKFCNQTLLDNIVFPNGTVAFQYDSRIDLDNSKRLTDILINNNLSPEKNQTYKLDQDYFTSNFSSRGASIINPEKTLLHKKRLKLKGVVQQDHTGKVNKAYSFNYDETNLPEKNSFSRDHWGYFNGSLINNSFLPKVSYKNPFITTNEYSVYAEGGNREPNPSFNQCFILKDITYPTGGKTVFEYETNDYDLSKSNVSDDVTYSEVTRNFFTRRIDEDVTEIYPLEVPVPSTVLKIEMQSTEGIINDPGYFPSRHEDAYFEIYSVSESKVVYHMPLGATEQWTSPGGNRFDFKDRKELTKGEYTIKLFLRKNVRFIGMIIGKFSWVGNEKQTDNHMKYGPGLRIKRITDEDALGGKNVRRYQYTYQVKSPDGRTKEYSFGKCLQAVRYLGNMVVPGCKTDPGNATSGGIICRSFVLYSDSYSQGSGVVLGYDQVTELQGEQGLNGKTEYQFQNEVDYVPTYDFSLNSFYGGTQPWNSFSIRPTGIPDIASSGNGLLRKKTYFKWDTQNAKYQMVSEHIKEYGGYTDFTAKALLGIRKIAMFQKTYCGVYTNCDWALGMYPALRMEWLPLKVETYKEYNPNDGTLLLSSQTQYQYERDPYHYNPIEVASTESNGKQRFTYTSYPSDYAAGNLFTDKMKQNHILLPIEKVNVLQEGAQATVVGGNLSLYNANGNGLLDKIYTIEAASPIDLSSFKFSNQVKGKRPTEDTPTEFDRDGLYKEKVAFTQYDNLGNTLQLQKSNDISLTYLCGYNQNYPIDEGKNATYAEVVAVLGQSVVDGLAGATPGSDAEVRAKLALLRTDARLKKAQVTTFTYQPLVGMTSATDPSGKTTYYEYDALQRLKRTKDSNGHLLRQQVYHYQGQTVEGN